MYLMDRPLVFVTNLYSSALLIGLAAVAGCLVMEYLFKNGVGLVVGTTLGAITVKIAHHLSTDGKDTLENLVAVLDTNFWLASHVTTVTLGYSATYIAGMLGIVYIVWGLFFTTLTREKHSALGNMIYGVTCFATLLSFVGTVLGGIWADQSWGRFWGWDPKENGAVLIVIWNALILHARWGGIVRQRGMAVLAVAGIMVTTWSWFGTNQLGVGLHNYGFNKTLAEGCMWTWLGSALIIALGLIPIRYWRSFSPTGEPRPETRVLTTAPAITPTAAQPATGAPTEKAPAGGQPSQWRKKNRK
jgi:ABC-type transport system involved in cytochrome c biogenesis permease subunit